MTTTPQTIDSDPAASHGSDSRTRLRDKTPDAIDAMRAEWHAILPETDTSPLEVFGRLRRINVLLQAESDRILGVHNVSRADFDIISALRRHQRHLSPTDIAATTLTSAAGTTKRLHRLVKVGLVTREPNPNDGRGSLIALTPRGIDIIAPILGELSHLEHRLLLPVSGTRQQKAVEALRLVLGELEDGSKTGRSPETAHED